MTHTFKVGDKVKVINMDRGGEYLLPLGSIHTISTVSDSYVYLEGVPSFWYPYRFELVNKTLTIEEQIKLAKSYIGKRIKPFNKENTSKSGLVAGVQCYTNVNELNNPTQTLIKDFNDTLDKYGIVICLVGRWDNTNRMLYPVILPIEEYKPEPWEDVKINGYSAKKTSYGYDFGCAKIDNSILQSARKFLKANENNYANGDRKIESVKIGAGEFTLDILNKLLQDEKPKIHRTIYDVKVGDWVINLVDTPIRKKGMKYEVMHKDGEVIFINIPGYNEKTSYIINNTFELVQ
jgi:hypothetical protein